MAFWWTGPLGNSRGGLGEGEEGHRQAAVLERPTGWSESYVVFTGLGTMGRLYTPKAPPLAPDRDFGQAAKQAIRSN